MPDQNVNHYAYPYDALELQNPVGESFAQQEKTLPPSVLVGFLNPHATKSGEFKVKPHHEERGDLPVFLPQSLDGKQLTNFIDDVVGDSQPRLRLNELKNSDPITVQHGEFRAQAGLELEPFHREGPVDIEVGKASKLALDQMNNNPYRSWFWVFGGHNPMHTSLARAFAFNRPDMFYDPTFDETPSDFMEKHHPGLWNEFLLAFATGTSDKDYEWVVSKLKKRKPGFTAEVAQLMAEEFLEKNPRLDLWLQQRGIKLHEEVWTAPNPLAWTHNVNRTIVQAREQERAEVYLDATGFPQQLWDSIATAFMYDPSIYVDIASNIGFFAFPYGIALTGARLAQHGKALATLGRVGATATRVKGGPMTGVAEGFVHTGLRNTVLRNASNSTIQGLSARAAAITIDGATQAGLYDLRNQMEMIEYNTLTGAGPLVDQDNIDFNRLATTTGAGGVLSLAMYGSMRATFFGLSAAGRGLLGGDAFPEGMMKSLTRAEDTFAVTDQGFLVSGSRLGHGAGIWGGNWIDGFLSRHNNSYALAATGANLSELKARTGLTKYTENVDDWDIDGARRLENEMKALVGPSAIVDGRLIDPRVMKDTGLTFQDLSDVVKEVGKRFKQLEADWAEHIEAKRAGLSKEELKAFDKAKKKAKITAADDVRAWKQQFLNDMIRKRQLDVYASRVGVSVDQIDERMALMLGEPYNITNPLHNLHRIRATADLMAETDINIFGSFAGTHPGITSSAIRSYGVPSEVKGFSHEWTLMSSDSPDTFIVLYVRDGTNEVASSGTISRTLLDAERKPEQKLTHVVNGDRDGVLKPRLIEDTEGIGTFTEAKHLLNAEMNRQQTLNKAANERRKAANLAEIRTRQTAYDKAVDVGLRNGQAKLKTVAVSALGNKELLTEINSLVKRYEALKTKAGGVFDSDTVAEAAEIQAVITAYNRELSARTGKKVPRNARVRVNKEDFATRGKAMEEIKSKAKADPATEAVTKAIVEDIEGVVVKTAADTEVTTKVTAEAKDTPEVTPTRAPDLGPPVQILKGINHVFIPGDGNIAHAAPGTVRGVVGLTDEGFTRIDGTPVKKGFAVAIDNKSITATDLSSEAISKFIEEHKFLLTRSDAHLHHKLNPDGTKTLEIVRVREYRQTEADPLARRFNSPEVHRLHNGHQMFETGNTGGIRALTDDIPEDLANSTAVRQSPEDETLFVSEITRKTNPVSESSLEKDLNLSPLEAKVGALIIRMTGFDLETAGRAVRTINIPDEWMELSTKLNFLSPEELSTLWQSMNPKAGVNKAVAKFIPPEHLKELRATERLPKEWKAWYDKEWRKVKGSRSDKSISPEFDEKVDIISRLYVARTLGMHPEKIKFVNDTFGDSSGAYKTVVFNEEDPDFVYRFYFDDRHTAEMVEASWVKGIDSELIAKMEVVGDRLDKVERGWALNDEELMLIRMKDEEVARSIKRAYDLNPVFREITDTRLVLGGGEAAIEVTTAHNAVIVKRDGKFYVVGSDLGEGSGDGPSNITHILKKAKDKGYRIPSLPDDYAKYHNIRVTSEDKPRIDARFIEEDEAIERANFPGTLTREADRAMQRDLLSVSEFESLHDPNVSARGIFQRGSGLIDDELRAAGVHGNLIDKYDGIQETLRQDVAPATNRGSITFLQVRDSAFAVIRGSKASDISTFAHEWTHFMEARLLHRPDEAMHLLGVSREDLNLFYEWAGAKIETDADGIERAVWSRAASEKFAVGMEKFLRDDAVGAVANAAKAYLQEIFEMLSQWISRIYEGLTTLDDIEISPAAKRIYESLLLRHQTDETSMLEVDQMARRVVGLGPAEKEAVADEVVGGMVLSTKKARDEINLSESEEENLRNLVNLRRDAAGKQAEQITEEIRTDEQKRRAVLSDKEDEGTLTPDEKAELKSLRIPAEPKAEPEAPVDAPVYREPEYIEGYTPKTTPKVAGSANTKKVETTKPISGPPQVVVKGDPLDVFREEAGLSYKLGRTRDEALDYVSKDGAKDSGIDAFIREYDRLVEIHGPAKLPADGEVIDDRFISNEWASEGIFRTDAEIKLHQGVGSLSLPYLAKLAGMTQERYEKILSGALEAQDFKKSPDAQRAIDSTLTEEGYHTLDRLNSFANSSERIDTYIFNRMYNDVRTASEVQLAKMGVGPEGNFDPAIIKTKTAPVPEKTSTIKAAPPQGDTPETVPMSVLHTRKLAKMTGAPDTEIRNAILTFKELIKKLSEDPEALSAKRAEVEEIIEAHGSKSFREANSETRVTVSTARIFLDIMDGKEDTLVPPRGTVREVSPESRELIGQWYNEHYDTAVGIVNGLFHNAKGTSGDDAVMAVFTDLFEGRPHVSEVRDPIKFIVDKAKKKAINTAKLKENQAGPMFSVEEGKEQELQVAKDARVPTKGASDAYAAGYTEEGASILSKLPTEEERVLVAAAASGRKVAEIAKEIGKSPEATKKAIQRAKKKLHDILVAEGFDPKTLKQGGRTTLDPLAIEDWLVNFKHHNDFLSLAEGKLKKLKGDVDELHKESPEVQLENARSIANAVNAGRRGFHPKLMQGYDYFMFMFRAIRESHRATGDPDALRVLKKFVAINNKLGVKQPDFDRTLNQNLHPNKPSFDEALSLEKSINDHPLLSYLSGRHAVKDMTGPELREMGNEKFRLLVKTAREEVEANIKSFELGGVTEDIPGLRAIYEDFVAKATRVRTLFLKFRTDKWPEPAGTLARTLNKIRESLDHAGIKLKALERQPGEASLGPRVLSQPQRLFSDTLQPVSEMVANFETRLQNNMFVKRWKEESLEVDDNAANLIREELHMAMEAVEGLAPGEDINVALTQVPTRLSGELLQLAESYRELLRLSSDSATLLTMVENEAKRFGAEFKSERTEQDIVPPGQPGPFSRAHNRFAELNAFVSKIFDIFADLGGEVRFPVGRPRGFSAFTGETFFQSRLGTQEVFHGGTLDSSKAKSGDLLFVGSKGAAEHSAKSGKGKVIRGVVEINNPIEMIDSKRAHTPARIAEDIEAVNPGVIPFLKDAITKVQKDEGIPAASQALIQALRNKGYDSISFLNQNEDPGSTSYIVFGRHAFSTGTGQAELSTTLQQKGLSKEAKLQNELLTMKGRARADKAEFLKAKDSGVAGPALALLEKKAKTSASKVIALRKALKALASNEKFSEAEIAAARQDLQGFRSESPVYAGEGEASAVSVVARFLDDIAESDDPVQVAFLRRQIALLLNDLPEAKRIAIENKMWMTKEGTKVTDLSPEGRRRFLLHMYSELTESQEMVPEANNVLVKALKALKLDAPFGWMSRHISSNVSFGDTTMSSIPAVAAAARFFNPAWGTTIREMTSSNMPLNFDAVTNAAYGKMSTHGILRLSTEIGEATAGNAQEWTAVNKAIFRYVTAPDAVPDNTPHRALVLKMIRAVNEFNADWKRELIKIGSLAEDARTIKGDHFGFMHASGPKAYQDFNGFVNALTNNQLRTWLHSENMSIGTLEGMGWVKVATGEDGEVTGFTVTKDSPIAEFFDEAKLDKVLSKSEMMKFKFREVDAEGNTLKWHIPEDLGKRYLAALVDVTDDYEPGWRAFFATTGDGNITGLKRTMLVAAARLNQQVDPISKDFSGNGKYHYTEWDPNYSRIISHSELVEDPELIEYFEYQFPNLLREFTHRRGVDIMTTRALSERFGMTLNMNQFIGLLQEAVESQFPMGNKLRISLKKAMERFQLVWAHQTGKGRYTLDGAGNVVEWFGKYGRDVAMASAGVRVAFYSAASEMPKALLKSNLGRSMITQFLPNFLNIIKYGADRGGRRAMIEMGDAFHAMRAINGELTSHRLGSDPSETMTLRGSGGRQSGLGRLFNAWGNIARGEMDARGEKINRGSSLMRALGHTGGMLQAWQTEMIQAAHIHMATKSFVHNFDAIVEMGNLVDGVGRDPGIRSRFNKLAYSVGLAPEEAKEMAVSGMFHKDMGILKRAVDEGNAITNGHLDLNKLRQWAYKLDSVTRDKAENAISRFGAFIGMTQRNINREPTLMDLRVAQSPAMQVVKVFTQFVMSQSLQMWGKVERAGNIEMVRTMLGLYLAEYVGVTLWQVFSDPFIDVDDKVDEIMAAPEASLVPMIARVPFTGMYGWILGWLSAAYFKSQRYYFGDQTIPLSATRFPAPSLLGNQPGFVVESLMRDADRFLNLSMQAAHGEMDEATRLELARAAGPAAEMLTAWALSVSDSKEALIETQKEKARRRQAVRLPRSGAKPARIPAPQSNLTDVLRQPGASRDLADKLK